ncbi:hypothetical protein PsYK624_097370 [Phanerochaete sordida]|uniref:RCC1/BLIP-II protein n=1 Tax=Phanerochaete sordida TaxID=48140 RepID=A0A9P3GET9_9APHY|nr:hypothetical protein PsYK624_097370 [Phanerochaete sordida]
MREEIRRVNEALDELGDITKAYVSKDHPQVIPCHVWDMERVEPCQLPDIPEDLPHLAGAGLDRDLLDEETQIIKLAALDHVLIGLTNKGHVLRFNRLEDEATYRHGHWEYLPYFSELDKVSEHPVFSVGRLAPPSKMHITHVSASFETFTAYSTGPESVVLMSRTQTSNLGTQTLMQPHLKPTIIPSLQYRNVISVLLGDYHYGALTATGKLLTWGAFSKGALGLGDPANIDAGQPGGYHVKKQHPTTWRHRRLEDDESTPPDVRDPTEVHFNHGTEHKGKHAHVFAAAAAGWHMGALVIDLQQDASERDSL